MGKNHDMLVAKVVALESKNKELSSPNPLFHHQNIHPTFGSLADLCSS
jgi:hypothetical protein